MPRTNQADHEYAEYDDVHECTDHIRDGHGESPAEGYLLEQHRALHYHAVAPDDPTPGYADAGELNPHPERTCPHCGGRLTILIHQELADRAGNAAAAAQRALADYMTAASDILRFAEPFDPERLR